MTSRSLDLSANRRPSRADSRTLYNDCFVATMHEKDVLLDELAALRLRMEQIESKITRLDENLSRRSVELLGCSIPPLPASLASPCSLRAKASPDQALTNHVPLHMQNLRAKSLGSIAVSKSQGSSGHGVAGSRNGGSLTQLPSQMGSKARVPSAGLFGIAGGQFIMGSGTPRSSDKRKSSE